MNRLAHLLLTLLRRFTAHERMFALSVGIAIGVVAGFGAVGVRILIDAGHAAFAMFQGAFEGGLGLGWLGVVLAPALGGLIVGPIILRFAREAKGHGVPEVMAAMIQRGGFIRPRVALVKAVASSITIASGGSVGKEGPIVQIGSSIGSSIGHVLRVPPRLMRTFVACGAAGGIAAAFNAPIAGALFAVEIILGDFGFIQLAPIVTSSVIATVISRGLEGNFASFEVPHHTLVHPLELLPYAGLGVGAGVGAVIFIKVMDRMETLFEEEIKVPEWIKPAIGGLAIGVIALAFPQILGMGYEAINDVLHDRMPLLLAAGLVALKMLATSLTLASGGSGGVFAPSLFMGAMMGGVVGRVANWMWPTLTATSGAYALVGMAAMVGAATHAPITAIVIIFELTNDYKIILPLMISTIISVVTAHALYRESIYTDKLRRKGIELQRGMEINLLKRVKARDVMQREFDSVPQDMPFSFLADIVLHSAYGELPVVSPDGRITGVVSRESVKKHLLERDALAELVIARDVAQNDAPIVLPEDTLHQVNMLIQTLHCHEVFVVDARDTRRLIGVLHKEDLTDAYHKEIMKQAAGETFAHSINMPQQVATVDVMDGYGIIELEAPHAFSGKLLRELDLRNRFVVSVLAIKRVSTDAGAPRTRMWVPESADRIQDGDVMVLMGEHAKISAFRRSH